MWHGAAVAAAMGGVIVSNVREPGPFGADDLGDIGLIALAFVIAYGFFGPILRGQIGWDQPPKDQLRAKLERDARTRENDS